MSTTILDCLRILLLGLIAFISGALTIDWLGDSWWARIAAVIVVLPVVAFVMRPGVPDGED